MEFILLYREKNAFTSQSFEQLVIGPAQQNTYYFKNRKPSTTYEFAMKSQNQLGKSVSSKSIEFKTSGMLYFLIIFLDIFKVYLKEHSSGHWGLIFCLFLSPNFCFFLSFLFLLQTHHQQ